jgi:hypothetical protein
MKPGSPRPANRDERLVHRIENIPNHYHFQTWSLSKPAGHVLELKQDIREKGFRWHQNSTGGDMKSWITGIVMVFTGKQGKAAGLAGSRQGTSPVLNQRIIWYIVLLFVLLEILDASMTNWAVTAGIVREGNPLLTQMAGGWNFLLLKLIGAGLSAITLLTLYKHFPRLSLAAASIISIYYTAVLVWNSGMVFNTWLTL